MRPKPIRYRGRREGSQAVVEFQQVDGERWFPLERFLETEPFDWGSAAKPEGARQLGFALLATRFNSPLEMGDELGADPALFEEYARALPVWTWEREGRTVDMYIAILRQRQGPLTGREFAECTCAYHNDPHKAPEQRAAYCPVFKLAEITTQEVDESAAGVERACAWEDGEGDECYSFTTGCGEAFGMDYLPERFVFCPFCGKHVYRALIHEEDHLGTLGPTEA